MDHRQSPDFFYIVVVVVVVNVVDKKNTMGVSNPYTAAIALLSD